MAFCSELLTYDLLASLKLRLRLVRKDCLSRQALEQVVYSLAQASAQTMFTRHKTQGVIP